MMVLFNSLHDRKMAIDNYKIKIDETVFTWFFRDNGRQDGSGPPTANDNSYLTTQVPDQITIDTTKDAIVSAKKNARFAEGATTVRMNVSIIKTIDLEIDSEIEDSVTTTPGEPNGRFNR